MAENSEVIKEFIDKMGELDPQTEYKDYGKMRIIQLMAAEIKSLRLTLNKATESERLRRELLEIDSPEKMF